MSAITILGGARRACTGPTRRETLKVGALSLLGGLFAGAGIRGGTIHGASDDQAAFIKDRPVHVRDICATIYHLLGIDPRMPVFDRANRPVEIAHGGRPIKEILL